MTFLCATRSHGFAAGVFALAALGCGGTSDLLLPGPGPGEPTFATADQLVYADSFGQYLDLVDMVDVPSPRIQDNRSTPIPDALRHALLGPGRGGAGVMLRSTYLNSGSQQEADWITFPTGSRYSPASATVAIQYHFRISSGGGPGAAGMKWFMMWTGSNNDRTQVGLEHGSDARPLFHMEPALSGGVNDRAQQPAGPYWDDINDGQWHRWTVLYKPNTNYGYDVGPPETLGSSGDGVLRVWIDGSKIIDVSASAVGITPPGGTKPWCTASDLHALPDLPVDFILWPGNQNGLNRPQWTVDFDDFLWWIERG